MSSSSDMTQRTTRLGYRGMYVLLPEMQWQLDNRSKQVLSVVCNKVKCCLGKGDGGIEVAWINVPDA